MKVRTKDGGVTTFRQNVGSGAYGGIPFKFGVATNAVGDIVGLPVITWNSGTTVILELEDLVPLAYKAAFGEGSSESSNCL